MKKHLSKILFLILALGVILPIGTSLAAPTADTLVVLHPHSTEFAAHIIDAFEIWYEADTGTPITVSTTEKYSGDCWAEVELWNGTSPEADVWWGGGEYYFEQGRKADLLVPYNVTEDGNVTASIGGWHLKDDSGDYSEHAWYAAAMSGFGIMYNTEYLTANDLDIPTTWADLADPSYYGHISMTDPDLSGSTVAIVKQLLMDMADEPSGGQVTSAADVTDAWALWVKIAANVDVWTSGSSKTPAEVVESNYGIGLVIDYYARDYMKNVTYDYIGFNYGGATTVSPDPAGIIKGTTKLAEAQKFMDFLISTEGQTLVGDYRTPANFKADTASHIPKAFTSTGGPTASFPAITTYNPGLDGAIHSNVEALFHYWLVEAHTELKQAMKQINTMTDATSKATAMTALTKLPSDFNGTMGSLDKLAYKDSNATASWTAHGKAQFDEAYKLAGGGAVPGFEIAILLISFVVIIPIVRKKNNSNKKR
ncbi:MAG: ABC transporter substrate-binding protein [Candidatus Hodarchaeales archaeon]|jgi:ABC-type Fe3+ transport system substrate-binding protein